VKALLLSLAGSGVVIPILGAAVRHYTGRALRRRDAHREGRP
jgi:hypothetical protein